MVENYAMMDALTEEMLVTRAQEEDGDAFGELMRRTFNRSLTLACSILADLEEAEDQVQNSYLKAWLHLSQFERQSRFSTWVYRIVAKPVPHAAAAIARKTFCVPGRLRGR